MNDEKLIELVKNSPALYNLEDSKYSDTNFKEKLWLNISKEVNMSESGVKARWTALRDQFRNYLKKNVTRSGQAASYVKKWRYYEEMSFLLPYLRSRKSISNFTNYDTNTETEIDNIPSNQEFSQDIKKEVEAMDENEILPTIEKPTPARQGLKRKLNKKKIPSNETASSFLMKYLISKQKTEETQSSVDKNSTDLFFKTIAEKVKKFSPFYRNLAESKIFSLVQQMELKQIQKQSHDSPYNQSSTPSPATTNTTTTSFFENFTTEDAVYENT